MLRKTSRSWVYELAKYMSAALTAVALFSWLHVWGQEAKKPSTTKLADAKGFKIIPIEVDWAKQANAIREHETTVRQVLSGSSPLAENRVVFDDFFHLYFFPSWTQTTEENLSVLPKNRDEFIRVRLQGGGRTNSAAEKAHDRLLELTFTDLPPIIRNKEFHPAVRYNAMMVVGNLNLVEAVMNGATHVPPQPYNPALPFMLEELKKDEQHDGVRIAALLGILRHLEWDPYRPERTRIPQAVRAEALEALLKIAESKTPVFANTDEAHIWMRRRALEGLVFTSNSPAEAKPLEKKSADLLQKILVDDAELLLVRCVAAESIGKMNYKQPPIVMNPKEMARSLAHLAVVACREEVESADAFAKQETLRSIAEGATTLKNGVNPMNPMGGQPFMRPPGINPSAPPPLVPSGPGDMDMTPPGGPGPPRRGPRNSREKDVAGKDAKPQDPKLYRANFLRRRLRADLFSVQVGLVGADNDGLKYFIDPKRDKVTQGAHAYAKTDIDKFFVNDVITKLSEVIKVLETPDQDMETFKTALEVQLRNLVVLTKPDVGAPVEAGPAAAGDDEPPVDAKAAAPKGAPVAAAPGDDDAPPAADKPAEKAAAAKAGKEPAAKAPVPDAEPPAEKK